MHFGGETADKTTKYLKPAHPCLGGGAVESQGAANHCHREVPVGDVTVRQCIIHDPGVRVLITFRLLLKKRSTCLTFAKEMEVRILQPVDLLSISYLPSLPYLLPPNIALENGIFKLLGPLSSKKGL